MPNLEPLGFVVGLIGHQAVQAYHSIQPDEELICGSAVVRVDEYRLRQQSADANNLPGFDRVAAEANHVFGEVRLAWDATGGLLRADGEKSMIREAIKHVDCRNHAVVA